jgi:hypothetical protein
MSAEITYHVWARLRSSEYHSEQLMYGGPNYKVAMHMKALFEHTHGASYDFWITHSDQRAPKISDDSAVLQQ